MKKIYIFLTSISLASALEFDIIGNTPASVGGAGVAYTKNSWAIHYNPALLGVNNNFNIAYSFGAGFGENNLAELTNIDYKNIQNFPKEIKNIMSSTSSNTKTSIMTRNTNTKNFENLGQITVILSNMGNNGGIKNTENLKTYIDGVIGQSSDINQAIQNLKKSENLEKINTIKQDLENAITKTEQSGIDVSLIGSIISNIDVSKIPNLLESINKSSGSGNIDFKELLTSIGGIKISSGVNQSLDKLINDYQIIINSTQNNDLKIHSNNGLVFHMPVGLGSLGIGMLANANGFYNLKMDKQYNKLIIQNESDYYEVSINNNSISLAPSDDSSYTSSSILNSNAKHNLNTDTLILIEVPIAYGIGISSFFGDLYLGASAKYINATSIFQNQTFSLDNIKLNFNLKNHTKQTNTFGIDIGALYKISGFSVGMVGKNINTPKVDTSIGKFNLDKQLRAGIGLEFWRFTILADIDIIPNTTLDPNKKNQMTGGGVIFDATYVDFRFGAMTDIKPNPYGIILTGGMNIFNFLDFSIQSSLKLKQIDKYKMPNYLDIRVGGRFFF